MCVGVHWEKRETVCQHKNTRDCSFQTIFFHKKASWCNSDLQVETPLIRYKQGEDLETQQAVVVLNIMGVQAVLVVLVLFTSTVKSESGKYLSILHYFTLYLKLKNFLLTFVKFWHKNSSKNMDFKVNFQRNFDNFLHSSILHTALPCSHVVLLFNISCK